MSPQEGITDEKIEKAVAGVGGTASSANDEPAQLREMLMTLNRHGDGTNVIKESITTFSMNPDGSEKKGDVMVPASEIGHALKLLKQLVAIAKEKTKRKEKAIFDFSTVPHQEFGKTLDETFQVFLLWGRTRNEDKDEINASKSFRRLEQYADWMYETGTELTNPPLEAHSVGDALRIWGMKASTDKNGRLAWWFDLGTIDHESLENELTPVDTLRAFVWYAHFIMFDSDAQENGVVFVQNLDNLGFMQMVTLFPMKVGTKLDRLTIGILPVKMNALYMLESPKWMKLLMKFLGVFMSQKMKERLVFLKDNSKVEEITGNECIPKGFAKLKGSLEVDKVEEKYFAA